jgi:oligosaccharide repeat unit polymerase
VLNPIIVFSAIWIAVPLASPLSGLDFYEYTGKFYEYLAAAVAVFVIGAVAGWFLFVAFPAYEWYALRNGIGMTGDWKVAFYIAVMTVALVIQAYNRSVMVGAGWWTPESVVFFRHLTTEEYLSPPVPWVSYLNFFFFSAVPVLLCQRSSQMQRVAIYTLLLVFVYFSSARASIFTIALIAYFFDWQQNGFRLRLTMILAAVLSTAFILIAILTGKVAAEGEHFTLLAYALAPSHALDQILNNMRMDRPGAFYTFPFLHGILHRNQYISEQFGNAPFYPTPHPTNVYTIFGPYILDYGVGWSLFCIGAIGLMSGFVFRAAREVQDTYIVFLYSLILSLLCLSVFHDHFTSSGYVVASIVLGLFFFPLRANR